MATPGVLRVLETLESEPYEEFTPLIDDEGRVSYPAVEECLQTEEPERSPFDLLESLTEREILYHQFTDKAYVCPGCRTEGMRYSSLCPHCRSPHAIEEEELVHIDCGGGAPPESFRTSDGEYVCPSCDLTVLPEHTEQRLQYSCRDCGGRADEPMPGLRCRECLSIYEPHEAIEWVLYSYGFENGGHRWLENQLAARQTAKELLEGRGFTVTLDTTVSNETETVPVHLYGEDELLSDRVVADVHEWATETDVESLLDAAEITGGRALLITTSGEVTERARKLIDSQGVGHIRQQKDGSLKREADPTPTESTSSMVERLTGRFRQQLDQ